MGESVDKYKSEYERAKKEFDSILPQIDNKIINRNFFSNYSDKAKKILENGYYYISQYKKAIKNYKNSKSTNGNIEKSLERELNEEQGRIKRLQVKIDKIIKENSKLIKDKKITINENISTPWEINKEEQTATNEQPKSRQQQADNQSRQQQADNQSRQQQADNQSRQQQTNSLKADSNKRTTKADSNKRTA